MTTEDRSPDPEVFRWQAPLVINGCTVARVDRASNLRMVTFIEMDFYPDQAIAIRDWLNQVLPKDACKPGEHSYQDVPVCVHCGDQP